MSHVSVKIIFTLIWLIRDLLLLIKGCFPRMPALKRLFDYTFELPKGIYLSYVTWKAVP